MNRLTSAVYLHEVELLDVLPADCSLLTLKLMMFIFVFLKLAK